MNRENYVIEVLQELSKTNDKTVLVDFIQDLIRVSNLKPYCDALRTPFIKLEFNYKLKPVMSEGVKDGN